MVRKRNRIAAREVATAPWERVGIDLYVLSLKYVRRNGGYGFLAVIVDEFSKYCVVFALKTKSNLELYFQRYCLQCMGIRQSQIWQHQLRSGACGLIMSLILKR